jgi:hypothetical protein
MGKDLNMDQRFIVSGVRLRFQICTDLEEIYLVHHLEGVENAERYGVGVVIGNDMTGILFIMNVLNAVRRYLPTCTNVA